MIYENASRSAATIIAELLPFCKRIEVSGTVRRQQSADNKILTFIAVANPGLLFHLRGVLNTRWGKPADPFPHKLTKIRGTFNIDIHWVPAKDFGFWQFWKTGPPTFVEPALQEWKSKNGGTGFMLEGKLYRRPGSDPETCLEEVEVFRLLGHNWVRPENRGMW
jgi:hypothetical protein